MLKIWRLGLSLLKRDERFSMENLGGSSNHSNGYSYIELTYYYSERLRIKALDAEAFAVCCMSVYRILLLFTLQPVRQAGWLLWLL